MVIRSIYRLINALWSHQQQTNYCQQLISNELQLINAYITWLMWHESPIYEVQLPEQIIHKSESKPFVDSRKQMWSEQIVRKHPFMALPLRHSVNSHVTAVFFPSFCIRWFMYIRGFEHRKRQIKKKSKTLSAFANFAVKWQLRAVDRLRNYSLTNITYIAFRCNAPDNNNNKVIKVHNIHSKKWPATVQQLKRSMMMHLNRQHEPIVYSLCMWNTLNYVTIHGARATATDARVVHSISGRRLHFHSLLVLLLLLLLVFVCCITKMKVWIFWIEYVVLW